MSLDVPDVLNSLPAFLGQNSHPCTQSSTPSGSSPLPSTTTITHFQCCTKCHQIKSNIEFYDERVPLAELGGNALDSSHIQLFSNCRACRKAQKRCNDRRNEKRRKKADEAKSFSIRECTWEEIERQFEKKYPPNPCFETRLTDEGNWPKRSSTSPISIAICLQTCLGTRKSRN